MAESKTSLNNKQKRQLAEHLFMGEMSQKDIAAYLSTSEKTISTWATKGKWKEMRELEAVSTPKLISNAHAAINMIYEKAAEEERPLDSKESDMILKQSATIKNLQKELNVQVATMVLKAYNKHLIEVEGDLELAKQLIESQREFVFSIMPGE